MNSVCVVYTGKIEDASGVYTEDPVSYGVDGPNVELEAPDMDSIDEIFT